MDENRVKANLYARIPYGVKVQAAGYREPIDIRVLDLNRIFNSALGIPKPYLRKLSSMTDDEKEELKKLVKADNVSFTTIEFEEGGTLETYMSCIPFGLMSNVIDWLHSKHFDYLGLIKDGQALEAPEGLYDD